MEKLTCQAEGCTKKALFGCGRCASVKYCSPNCQFVDWPKHAPKCIVARKWAGLSALDAREEALVVARPLDVQIPRELATVLRRCPEALQGWACRRLGSTSGVPQIPWKMFLAEVYNHAVFSGSRVGVAADLAAACDRPFATDDRAEMWKYLPSTAWFEAQQAYAKSLDKPTLKMFAEYIDDGAGDRIAREDKEMLGKAVARAPSSQTDFYVWRYIRDYVGEKDEVITNPIKRGYFEYRGPISTSLYSNSAVSVATDYGTDYAMVLRIRVRAGTSALAAVGLPMIVDPVGTLGPYSSTESEVMLPPGKLLLENVHREQLVAIRDSNIFAYELLVADVSV